MGGGDGGERRREGEGGVEEGEGERAAQASPLRHLRHSEDQEGLRTTPMGIKTPVETHMAMQEDIYSL